MSRNTYGEAGPCRRRGLRRDPRWHTLLGFMALIVAGCTIVWGMPEGRMLRFSDTPYLHRPSSTDAVTPIRLTTSEPDSPMASAEEWLERNGWQQLWPLWPLSERHLPLFAGPATQRYLRINASDKYYIWGRPLNLDPHRFPILAITWGVDRFPKQAALDVYGRNDRPIVVLISFGAKVRSPGLLPNVPRALAFFWGESETVGASYTCIKPRQGPADKRMQCTYPHIKYIALRRGGPGTVHTDRVNLLDYFRRYFPDYWKQHQRVPPVSGVSFEARSDKTESVTIARLYAIAFTAEVSSNGQPAEPQREGN